jgi:Ca2+:H+ antiporter
LSGSGTAADGVRVPAGTRQTPDGRRGATGRSGLSRLERAALAGTAALTGGAGAARYLPGAPHLLAFALAGLALAGAAWIVSLATEQVGGRLGPAPTGLLQSTLGNLPEFFAVLFALEAGERIVAETAILGSIFVNALLVLGLVLIAGALRARDGIMRFSARLPNDTATLLLLAAFIIILVGLAHVAQDPASRHARAVSIIGAVAILIVYGAWLRQYLGAAGGASLGSASGLPTRVPLGVSLALLACAGAASAFASDWFVHALQPSIRQLHISQTFAGLVIVAIAGNAVENAAGIVLAHRGHADLAISVVKNSVAQIAAFLYPVLVLVSLLTATTLTFALAPIYIGALLATAVIIWQITGDGEGTAFEGAALVAMFAILAAVALFET